MAVKISKKVKWILALAPIAVVLLLVASQALRVLWFRGYSKGSRTGIVTKVMVKGPPYCKYLEGEMRVGAGAATLTPETWTFSVDDDSEANPVVVALKEAEKTQKAVTLDYRQDLHALYRCSETEYFITNVQK